jgi:hypothetical protein
VSASGGLRVGFDRRLKFEFHGAKVTSNGGLLLYWELDEVLGLTPLAKEVLHDTRKGKNAQHSQTALLRQSIYSRLAGYEEGKYAIREGGKQKANVDKLA